MQQQQQVTNSVGGGVSAVPPGSAFVYMMPSAPIRVQTYDRYKHKQSIGLGATQIIIAILCFIFNSVCIGVTEPARQGREYGFVGHGYWCGIMFLITGILGVVAGKKKAKCQIVAFMVLCIFSAIFTIGLLTVGILGALFTGNEQCYKQYDYYGYSYNEYYYYPNYQWVCYSMSNYKVIVAMESCLAIAGFVEVIVAIWGSALACGSGVCCCSGPTMAMPAGGYFPTTGGQMVCISQTQGGPYVYAPQPNFAYPQTLIPPPAYIQPGWTNVAPGSGQAPPAYAVNQGQPLFMLQPGVGNAGPLATTNMASEQKVAIA